MKQITSPRHELPPVAGLFPGLFEPAFASAKASLRRWRERATQRRRLAGLSLRELDDIGITDAERLDESAKPFWRP